MMVQKLFIRLIGLVLIAIFIDLGIIFGLFSAAKSLQGTIDTVTENLSELPHFYQKNDRQTYRS